MKRKLLAIAIVGFLATPMPGAAQDVRSVENVIHDVEEILVRAKINETLTEAAANGLLFLIENVTDALHEGNFPLADEQLQVFVAEVQRMLLEDPPGIPLTLAQGLFDEVAVMASVWPRP